MLPKILRPLVTDIVTTMTLSKKKTSPKIVIIILHHFLRDLARAIAHSSLSARTPSNVKSIFLSNTVTSSFQLCFDDSDRPIIPYDELSSLGSSCKNKNNPVNKIKILINIYL